MGGGVVDRLGWGNEDKKPEDEGERPKGSGMASASQDEIEVGNTIVEDQEKVGPAT